MDQATTDQLLECLLRLCELQGRPVSKQLLCEGLPLPQGRLTLDFLEEATQKAGFHSQILKRSHTELLHVATPFILVGENNQACVITKINRLSAELEKPETEGVTELPRSELTRYYSDYVILLQPITPAKAEEIAREESLLGVNQEKNTSANKSKEKISESRWYAKHLPSTKGLIKPYQFALALATLCSLCAILLSGVFIDASLQHTQPSTLKSLSFGLLIFSLGYIAFTQLAALFKRRLEYIVGPKQDEILLRKAFAAPLPNTSLSAHAIEQKALENFRFFLLHQGIPLQIALLFSPLALILIFLLSGYLVLASFGAIAILFSYFLVIELPIRNQSKTSAKILQQKVLSEKGLGINAETIKANLATSYIRRAIIDARLADSALHARAQRFQDINKQLSILVIAGTAVLLAYIGGLLVLAEQLSIGALISAIGLSIFALSPFKQMLALLPQIAKARNFIASQKERILAEAATAKEETETGSKHPLKQEPTIDNNAAVAKQADNTPPLISTNFNPTIHFEHVDFHYPENPIPVLRNISLSIETGEKVAIIGNSGAGKSAILKLILGLYSPSNGQVSLAGHPTKPAAKFYRGQIGYCPQHALLIPGSVTDNLLLGQHELSEQAIEEAAKLSGVAEFIQLQSNGYHSQLDSWSGFSEGQRQQILLCRALAGNKNLWLLDEPTQNIDTSTESKLIARMRAASADKTILVVTHKPALLALVDRVIILDNGRIIANGPKNDVLQNLKKATRSVDATPKTTSEQTEANDKTATISPKPATGGEGQNQGDSSAKELDI